MPKLKYRLDGSPVNLTLPDETTITLSAGQIFEVSSDIAAKLLKTWKADDEGMRLAEEARWEARNEVGLAAARKDNDAHQVAMKKLEEAGQRFEKARNTKIPIDDPRFEEVP